MAASTNCNGELIVSTKVHRANHVGNICAARDERRSLVDHAIIDLACSLIVHIAWLKQFTAQLCAERSDSLCGKLRGILGNRLNGHGFSFSYYNLI
jgi:hypothetical protein